MEAAKYEHVRQLGKGTFGVTELMRNLSTGKLVAVKFLERGPQINEYAEREILNHRILRHPFIVEYREIAMEYASGGELFEYLCHVRRFSENEARYFFQQLIAGIDYCHQQGVCHRDLKLENILLDGSPAPRLKICDFGYSKHSELDSGPKSIVGTRAYIAPEVIFCKFDKRTYDGRAADVWSCGVVLYLMLVGSYPFEDPTDPNSFSKTIQKIMNADFTIPALGFSDECLDLLKSMLVAQPRKRITISAIKQHPFFRRNLPSELQAIMADNGQAAMQLTSAQTRQTLLELQEVMGQARLVPQPQLQPLHIPSSRAL